MMNPQPLLYRPCVGLCIFNAERKVFVGERIDNPGGWQMPQGGVDDDEDIRMAAFREMKEEIGTDKADILRVHDKIIRYDIPEEVRKNLPWGHLYGGQDQTWIALQFNGTSGDIKLDAWDHPEFSRYQWVDLRETVNLIVPFKRDVYHQVIEAFKDLAPV